MSTDKPHDDSYHIAIEGNILRVGFNSQLPVTGDRIVKDAETHLQKLIESEVLTGGDLLKINGRMSLPVSYTIAHKLGHLYSAIAVFDPRLKAYVVVISTDPKYQLGDAIDDTNNLVPSDEDCNKDKLSFSLNLESNNTVLKVGFNPQVKAKGDRIVRDTLVQLDSLINSGRLKGKLLKISGRASVLASFVIANKLAHCYGAIALFEPKEGSQGLDRYIVSISHSPYYRVGQTLDFESSYDGESLKIAICGFPSVGKTVLRDGLKTAIRQNLAAADDFLYVVSGCPDGDYPAWVADTAKNDPELAYRLRKACQAEEFTPELANAIAEGIKAIKNPLLLFDVGGQTSDENRQIMPNATHVIMVAKSESEIKAWEEFCSELNLPILAIIDSDLHGKEDCIQTTSPIFRGSVHYLQRGEEVSFRPTLQTLAKQIISLNK